ncbi:MAG: choice-of-anchor E domain-containing protein [Phycisphaerales bacterium]|nr:MAG: choice-of-anchor E domain-containing protein [Phycisphaerales bacterium]
MRTKIGCVLAAAGVLVVAGAASAQPATISYSETVPNQDSNWTETLQLPQFDPSLGTLTGITLSIDGSFAGEFAFENASNGELQVLNISRKWLISVEPVDGPTRAALLQIEDEWTRGPLVLAPFDGTFDFDGPSGNTDVFTGAASGSVSIFDFSVYTGLDTVGFILDHDAPFAFDTIGGSYGFGAFSTAGATLTVTYDYFIPAPGSLAAMLLLGGLTTARRRR